ncbi:MAG: DUF3572 domain-containing protein [Rhodobacter sp.]|nr:DUF3572 domain-containing protein [Paracoccaceae bacterium]MCB1411016.1 DUF3572 domain-containing protein [Paracoccaceae bacterium]MCC0079241.1 DUF3572 domain-containing protein [Rhodobacter sp.]
MSLTRATAETFAARVLAWLAEDHARIGGFLAWSGESPDSLRARLADPGLLLAVVDYLLLDESMLLDACSDLAVPPETPMQARAALPGGAEYHWT